MTSADVFIMLMLGLVVIGGMLAVFIIITLTRSHRLIVRDPSREKGYIKEYRMSEKVDKKTKVLYWKSVFWNPKLKTPAPPQEAIDIGKKGRKHAEAYKLSEDEFVWITDRGIKVAKDKETGQMVAYDVDEKGKLGKKIDSFAPFSPVQRQVIVDQFKKATEISAKKISTAQVMAIVGNMMVLAALALLLIFGGDFWAAMRSSHGDITTQNKRISDQNIDIMRANAALIQAMGINVEDMDITIAQSPKPQDTGDDVITGDTEDPQDIRDLVGLG